MNTALSPKPGKPTRVEDWLTAKQNQPGYFLIAIIGLALWAAGFIDLVTHTSNPRVLLGRYSIPYALFLLAFAAGFVLWLGALLRHDGAQRTERVVRFVQSRMWLSLAVFGLCATLIGSMFLIKNWANLPLFELAVLGLCVMVAATLLLARTQPDAKTPMWRKVLIGSVVTWLVAEAACQGAAALGVLPFENMSGAYTAYGRIYQNREGLANATTNRYGWYDADPKSTQTGRTILLTGDTFVQGLQVRPDQNVGQVLQSQLRHEGNANVFSLGFPGYTAALFTDPRLAPYTMLQFNPNEVVMFFHLANDLQATDEPTWQYPFYTLSVTGTLVRREDNAGIRHALQHLVIRAYDPVNPVQSMQSHLFTVQLLKKIVGYKYVYQVYGDQGVPPVAALNTDAQFVSDSQPFGRSTFAFDPNATAKSRTAFGITRAQLQELKTQLESLGIKLKLVSIPYYPKAFFAQQGTTWSARVGEYDALLPEVELGKIADELGIAYLPMGSYMQGKSTPVEQIKSLYFNEGRGHFTVAGHAYFAQAVHDCFYADGQGCPVSIRNK